MRTPSLTGRRRPRAQDPAALQPVGPAGQQGLARGRQRPAGHQRHQPNPFLPCWIWSPETSKCIFVFASKFSPSFLHSLCTKDMQEAAEQSTRCSDLKRGAGQAGLSGVLRTIRLAAAGTGSQASARRLGQAASSRERPIPGRAAQPVHPTPGPRGFPPRDATELSGGGQDPGNKLGRLVPNID